MHEASAEHAPAHVCQQGAQLPGFSGQAGDGVAVPAAPVKVIPRTVPGSSCPRSEAGPCVLLTTLLREPRSPSPLGPGWPLQPGMVTGLGMGLLREGVSRWQGHTPEVRQVAQGLESRDLALSHPSLNCCLIY